MKILQVCDVRFWRQELGSQQRISALSQHLLAQGHQLHSLFLGKPTAADRLQLAKLPTTHHVLLGADTLDESLALQPPAPPGWARRRRREARQLLVELSRLTHGELAGLPSARAFRLRCLEPKLADFVRPDHAQRFVDACIRLEPELVLIQFARHAWLLDRLPATLAPHCLKLIDTHDVQHLRQRRFHHSGERHDIDISAREEAAALARADALIAIQAHDAAALRQLLPRQRVIVAMHPHPLHQHPLPAGPLPAVGFFGSAMRPNAEAAERLISAIWPRLRAAGVAGRLHLFGGVCRMLDCASLPDDIIAHGFVEDLDAAYAGLDVVVNPVAFGGGLKIKNVEALCHGKPLLTSSIGAEGLETGIGSAFVLADDDAGFAQTLAELLGQPARRAALSTAALQFARQHLAADTVFAELDQLLAKHTRPRSAGGVAACPDTEG